MAFWDKLRGEIVDVIEWTDDSRDTIVYRFERYGNEIKNGAKLTVREGQMAVFVNEGKLADVFAPGMYELTTANLPVLSTLKGWRHGFESPFKAEVYFVKTTRFLDQKWGTKNPIILRDADFGAVRVRAFGTYSMRVADAPTFLREIVGTDGHFTTEEIVDQLRNIIVSRFSDKLAEARVPVLDVAARYDELGDLLAERIAPEMAEYGIELSKLLVENISVPPAVEEALDKRASMGAIGNLDAYMKFQSANAVEAAANNPAGGGASEGMGLGAGFAMAGQMVNAFGQSQAPQGPAAFPGQNAPPPPPPPAAFHVAVNGQTMGPYDFNSLQQQAAQGHLTPQTHVWRAGMNGWSTAGQVPELSSLFAPAPPPPPPAS
ncbi:MAG: SPFH domain-containing protein [Opitutales bacterium]